MKRNKELKNAALNALNGHWGWVILVCIISGAIIGIIAAPSSASSAMSALGSQGMAFGVAIAGLGLLFSGITLVGNIFGSYPLQVGALNSIKRFFKDSDIKTVQNMFKLGFGKEYYWRNVAGMLLMQLFIGLWTLLFIVPGIIKSYAYAITPYLLIDNPELGPNEVRLKSIEMMRGHKGKLFGLDLSFIGWILLGILSLGIGFIWITPYIKTTRAAFYYDLLEELNPQQPEAETSGN